MDAVFDSVSVATTLQKALEELGIIFCSFNSHKITMITPGDALPGRDRPAFDVPERHTVLGAPLQPPFPAGIQTAVFAL
ncbi:MAG: hypothetical protein WD627_12390, partial [Actinomycetota bacterium]